MQLLQMIATTEVDLRKLRNASPEFQDLVHSLLKRDPGNRLGSLADAHEIKQHPFFKSVDWEIAAKRQLDPPFIPEV